MQKDNELRFLSLGEWKSLERTEKSSRDALIIDILYTSGCTVNELVNIRVDDIDLHARTLQILAKHSRNHEPRIVYLSKSLVSEIRIFLNTTHPGTGTPYLLASRQSPRMTTKRVRQIVQTLMENAGIEGKNSPQILRYTHIVHAFQKGVQIPAIQKQVGIKRSRAIQIFNELKSETDEKAYRAFLE